MTEDAHSFIRSAGVVSALTLLSRLLGVIRDVACASVFGAGMVWDAFSFAFRVPNLFRRLFGEGALSAAFIPIFSEYLEVQRREEAWRLAGRIGGALIMVLTAILLTGESLLGGALLLADLGPRWRLTLSLTAVLLPYMLLICLTALAGAALHSLKHFAAPAAAPVVLNLCWILAVVAAAPAVSEDPRVQIFVVAGAILAAGLLQLGLQAAALHRRGFRWRPAFQPLHGHVRRVARRMAPVALGLAALQLNVLLDGVIAISLAAPEGKRLFHAFGLALPYPMEIGANSVLYYANRVMQFPLGVFGIALATAIFPTLSRLAARDEREAFRRSVLRGLGAALFVALPAGAGLILLRYPVVRLLFERGAFTPRMTARTARVVAAYSVGVWAYCALHLLTRAFYSLGRPSTPAKVAGAMVVLNLALNLSLVWPLREVGLAAATAVCAALQVVLLIVLLHRRVPLAGLSALARNVGKTALATVGMSAVVWYVSQVLSAAGDAGLAWRFLRALVPAGVGVAVFAGFAALLRSPEPGRLWRALRPGAGGESGQPPSD